MRKFLAVLIAIAAMGIFLTTGCTTGGDDGVKPGGEVITDGGGTPPPPPVDKVKKDKPKGEALDGGEVKPKDKGDAKQISEAAKAKLADVTRVNFEFDKSELTKGAQDKLRANAAIMKLFPTYTVTVTGHCDERGSGPYNTALGHRRAEAVKQFLELEGVTSDITPVSEGEDNPLNDAKTEAAYAENRRAEFSFSAK